MRPLPPAHQSRLSALPSVRRGRGVRGRAGRFAGRRPAVSSTSMGGSRARAADHLDRGYFSAAGQRRPRRRDGTAGCGCRGRRPRCRAATRLQQSPRARCRYTQQTCTVGSSCAVIHRRSTTRAASERLDRPQVRRVGWERSLSRPRDSGAALDARAGEESLRRVGGKRRQPCCGGGTAARTPGATQPNRTGIVNWFATASFGRLQLWVTPGPGRERVAVAPCANRTALCAAY
jgi:hypothetical protein